MRGAVYAKTERRRTWAAAGWASVRGRAGPRRERKRVSGPLGQIERRDDFPFSKSFSILFLKPNSIYEPNQIQIEFQIYFSTQLKMRNFGEFSKNKFYNFLNSFIFKFSSKSKSNHFES